MHERQYQSFDINIDINSRGCFCHEDGNWTVKDPVE